MTAWFLHYFIYHDLALEWSDYCYGKSTESLRGVLELSFDAISGVVGSGKKTHHTKFGVLDSPREPLPVFVECSADICRLPTSLRRGETDEKIFSK